MALVNQQAAANGQPSIGFANPALYAIGNGSAYNSCFHDITSGNNIDSQSGGLFSATAGYDLCTGWGSPKGQSLIDALAPRTAPYTISGNVRNSTGAGISGVTMSGLPGDHSTDASGYYSAAVTFGWSGTVTPGSAGYTFSPGSRSYSNLAANQTEQDYTGTPVAYSISGIVRTSEGAGISGVIMNGLPGNPSTDANGYYSAGVSSGWSGTVVPTKSDYSFTPPSQTYTSVTSGQTGQDYTGTAQTNLLVVYDLLHGYPAVLIGPTTFSQDTPSGRPGDFSIDFGTNGGAGIIVSNASFLNRAASNDVMTFSLWLKRYDIIDSSAFWAASPSSSAGERGFQAHIPWGDDVIYFDTAGCCDSLLERVSRNIDTFQGYQAVTIGGTYYGGQASDTNTWWLYWHHCIFIKNRTEKQVWIDGQQFLQGSNSSPLPTDFSQLWLGNSYLVNYPMHGLIDDFAVYSTALSSNNVRRLFMGVKATDLPGETALAYWSFDSPAAVGSAGTPSIAFQPQSQTAPLASSARFDVATVGAPPLSYQWRFHGTNLASEARISGNQSNLLVIGNLQPSDAGPYDVMVSNGFGAVTSTAAILAVSSNLLINGSFEQPFVGSDDIPAGDGWYMFFSTIPGWTGGAAQIEIQNQAVGLAFDGEQLLELDSYTNTSVSQTVATTLGCPYDLSFAYSPRPSVPASSAGIAVYWNNSVLTNLASNGVGLTNTLWTVNHFRVTGTGADTITFEATGTSDSVGGLLDAATLSPPLSTVSQPVDLTVLGPPVSNGTFTMRLTASPGASVVVEGSFNLVSWTSMQTNTLTGSGLDLAIPMGTNQRQFFRARIAQP
jgi:hypothetical protein